MSNFDKIIKNPLREAENKNRTILIIQLIQNHKIQIFIYQKIDRRFNFKFC